MSCLPLTQTVLDTPLISMETRRNTWNKGKADKTGYLVIKDCQYEILVGETKIGRNASVCTIILESETISQVHAVIESEGPEDSFLYDNNSTNKTKIGKMVLKPYCRYKISNNDLITIGSIISKFIIISHSNCNSPTSVLSSKTSELGIKDINEDNTINKLFVKQNDFNSQETNKEAITEIFKTPSRFDFSKFPKFLNKSVNESSPILDIFNQSTQCELVTEQDKTTKQQILYYSNCSDISDEIFNATTQCEFPVESEIFNLSTQCVIQKSTQTSKTKGLMKKTIFDPSVSDIFDHANKNKIQKFPLCHKDLTNEVDIFNCSTQFDIKVGDIISHNIKYCNSKISNIAPNSSQILGKKLQFAEESNDIEHNVQEEISKSEENKSVYEKTELNKTNNKSNFFYDNEDKEFCKLLQMNSQTVMDDDKKIHFAQQKTKSKYTNLFHNNIPDEIFDLPTQITGHENEQKNSVLCAEKMETDFIVLKEKSSHKCDPSFDTSIAVNIQVTENENTALSVGLVNLKEDNVVSGRKEDTYFLEEGKISDQKKIEQEFLAYKSDEDDMTQIQSRSENEFFREEQKLYAYQTMMDSNLININQCSKVNVGDFENDNSGIEQINCIKNELKLIDSGDETESDLEIKITLESSLKKENSQSQKYFINSGYNKSKDSNSSSLLPGNEDLRSQRSLSESSDRTVSDLDIIELQNDINVNIKTDKNIKDNEELVGTHIFSLRNDLRNSTEKALSDSDCYRLNSSPHIMEQMKNDFCEKSIAIPPCRQQSPLKLNKSELVNSDEKTYSDVEKFNKLADGMREYKKSEIPIEKDIKKNNDDNSNESESLIKTIEDSNILYYNILISQNEENIYHFNKMPMKVETNSDSLAKSDSSPTLLSSHPVFDAFSEINDILAKKSSRESSIEPETKINADLQIYKNEIPTHELLDVEKTRAFISKTVVSDSDETDCEVENYMKDKRWKDEERARTSSPISKVEQISFHEILYDDEMQFGQSTLQLAPTPEFKYESEKSFLSDPENNGNFHEELEESDGKKSVENRIKSSRNLFHKDEIKKSTCSSISYFTICKPDGIKINESPLKRAQQINLFDAIPKKKSKTNVRNVEIEEIKTSSKKVRQKKNPDFALCASEANLKVKNGIKSCKKKNLEKAPFRMNNSAETPSIQTKTIKKGRNECRFISEADLDNIMCPERDGFEISLKEKEEIKEEVKSNLRQRQNNDDYFSSGNGKRRRTQPELSEEMESKSSFTKIAFTGIESAAYMKIITQLGGEVVNDLKEGQVLVTDRARRTVKFLCAVARGIPIVSPKWLIASEKKFRLMNPWNFLLKDSKAEKLWDFNLKNSLDKAKKHKLLHGYSVFATESTKPPVPEILDIVACCGGIPLISLPDIWPEKSIVVTCNEDKKSWPSRKHRHVKIVHYEIILGGVLKQLIDFKTYKLR